MALLFLDSCGDHYSDPQDKYLTGGGAIVTGRHGNGRSTSSECRLVLTPASKRLIIGAAYTFPATFNVVYEVWDVGLVCRVLTTNEGGWEVELYGGASVLSAGDVWRVGQWHYIEVDLTIEVEITAPNMRYALSACHVYVDGAEVINTPPAGTGGLHTAPPSTYHWTHIDITPTATGGIIDDVYVCDGSGPAPHNAPLGDLQIGVIRPNGAGLSTAWTPTGAASNWDCVNDLTPDGDTSRVSAATSPLSELYALEDISTGNTVLGAQMLISARRTEEGDATLIPLLRHGGVTTELTPQALATTYFYRNRDVFVTMPNGDPLTDANVNALQAGVKRSA